MILKHCIICDCDTGNLGSHLRHVHNISGKEYYDKYIKKDLENICPVCGRETQFFGITKGYAKYCSCKCKANSIESKTNTYNTRLKLYGKSCTNIEKLRNTRLLHSIEHFKNYFDHTNAIFLRYEPENNKQIYFKCKICNNESHVVRSLVDRLNRKHDYNICPICFNKQTSSRMENEVFEYCKSIYSDIIIHNDRTVIKPKELDIWFPKLNKAIEFDGHYWHQDIEKDIAKNKLCEDHNIKLLRITDNDWINNKRNCINIILNFLKN